MAVFVKNISNSYINVFIVTTILYIVAILFVFLVNGDNLE